MTEHVAQFFPYDDLPEIFGLHKSATEKATIDYAFQIMQRTYKHQFVVKKPQMNQQVDKSDKRK